MKISKMKSYKVYYLACVTLVSFILVFQVACCVRVIIRGDFTAIFINVVCAFISTLCLISIIRTYKYVKQEEERIKKEQEERMKKEQENESR